MLLPVVGPGLPLLLPQDFLNNLNCNPNRESRALGLQLLLPLALFELGRLQEQQLRPPWLLLLPNQVPLPPLRSQNFRDLLQRQFLFLA